jgi:lysophospholipase L1-like esterase
VNIVFDGNSLFSGVGASGSGTYLPTQVAGIAPMSGSGASYSNKGVSGQTWRQMDGFDGGSSSDVDAAWVNGKTNILVTWETSNSVFNTGRTAAQTIVDAQSYINNRLTAHSGWKIVLMTTLPRQISGNQTLTNTNNAINETVDAYFRQNYRAMGAKALVDIRAGNSPFNFTGYTNTDFSASNTDSLWYEALGGRVHPNDAGYAVIAKMIANTLRRLGIR